MNRITSFCVDHDYIKEGVYVSRIDGDVTTYDLRTRLPNAGDYMDNLTMHSVEHMFATYVRNSAIADRVIYFGPSGCRTGFYLLVREADKEEVYAIIRQTLEQIIAHTGAMFGASQKECGNYRELSVEAARAEAARYLSVLPADCPTMIYPKGE